jgi:hypothetical protein
LAPQRAAISNSRRSILPKPGAGGVARSTASIGRAEVGAAAVVTDILTI